MRPLFLLTTLLLSLVALACSSGDNDSGKLDVVATTTQIGDFAREIGGDRIDLTVLLKPGQDAHDFSPSPSQVRRLSDADLILRNGIGLDYFVVKAVRDQSKVTVVTQGITLRTGGEAGEHADEDEHEEDEGAAAEASQGDPHVWFDARNAARMATNIAGALSEADPGNAAFYNENALRYGTELTRLDTDLRAQVQGLPQSCRKLVTNHDALGYFADAYGFTVVGSVIPNLSTEAQPSASDLARLVQLIKEQRVPAIFAESSVNPALAQQVGREAGVKVVTDLYADALGPKGSDGATYIGMMRADANKIVEALKGC